MRFFLDMNVPPAIAERLQAEGPDAIHVSDAGHGNLSDREIFAQAAAQGRIVVTFDLDFGEIAGLAIDPGPAVVLLRLRLARQSHIWERLRVAIAEAGEAMATRAVVLVEDSRIRVRRMSAEE